MSSQENPVVPDAHIHQHPISVVHEITVAIGTSLKPNNNNNNNSTIDKLTGWTILPFTACVLDEIRAQINANNEQKLQIAEDNNIFHRTLVDCECVIEKSNNNLQQFNLSPAQKYNTTEMEELQSNAIDSSYLSRYYFNLPLAHAYTCPAHAYNSSLQNSSISTPTVSNSSRKLRLAVCVLVLDCNGSVLLTRRASGMRSFARCWVIAGGSVDNGEDLEEAGAREVEEETGLKIDKNSMKPLCLWESLFPTRLEAGPFTSHHIILFFTAKLAKQQINHYDNNIVNMNESSEFDWHWLKLSPVEVDRAAFVPVEPILQAFTADEMSKNSIKQVSGYSIESNGSCSKIPVNLNELSRIYRSSSNISELSEGIGGGHLFALSEYYRQQNPAKPLKFVIPFKKP